jgi:putative transposase
MIDVDHPTISIQRQCILVGLARSSYYYQPIGESPENLRLMRVIDAQYLETPFFGVRRMAQWLRQQGEPVNEKRVRRLMQLMGIEALYPKPRLSVPGAVSQRHPYLLRGVAISQPDFVWSTDITYVPLAHGFVYLVAIMDWYSRYVLAWELSNTLDTAFCLSALDHALTHGRPAIFNTDQGAQFTSQAYVGRLEAAGIRISWDGRGRALDNVFVERLWRSVKWEEVYLHSYETVPQAYRRLEWYFSFYNHERPHQRLDGRTPAQVYFDRSPA